MIEAAVRGMAASGTPIDRFFHDWRGGEPREGSDYSGEAWAPFREAVAGMEASGDREHPYWRDAAPCSMHIDEVEAIWSAIADRDDWSHLYEKVAAVRRMGEALGGKPEVP